MTATHNSTDAHGASAPSTAPVLAGVLAEFDSPAAVTRAARLVTTAGYRRVDAHVPFPFHELDAALAIGKTRLPWISLSGAAVGGTCALLMQWWMNAVNYPVVISAKPLFSLPSSIPVIFACCILFASITTLITMLLLNGLPRLSNPLFRSERFRRATNDRFFISVDARDRKFNHAAITELLQSAHPVAIEDCFYHPAERKIPSMVWTGALVVFSLLTVPPAIVAHMRSTESRLPRWHLIQDMDFQPKFKPQSENRLFADLRAERPQVSGTVARGDLEEDPKFYRGLSEDVDIPVVAAAPAPATPPAGATPPAAGDAAAAAPPVDPLDSLPWVTEFPVTVDLATMQRGQERYNIYCASCHGLGGDGDGLITLRAIELEQPTWVRPVTYHSDGVRNQPIGRLFNSVTNGVRKMPPMGDVIPVQDRWAILMYLRALQRSRNAAPNDVPADFLSQLQGL